MNIYNPQLRQRILSIALAIGILPIGWLSSQPVFGAPITNSMTQIGISASLFNDQNQVIENSSYDIRFAIYTTDRKTSDPYPSNTDARIWEETQKVDVKSGLIKAFLGSVVPFPANLNFQTGDYYIGIRIGTDSEMVPRKKLSSVPSAINSQYLQGKTIGINKGDIPIIASTGTLDVAILKKINQVGTIKKGVWEGTVIADSYIVSDLTSKTYNGINLLTTTGNHTLTLSTDITLNQNLSLTSDVIFNTLSLVNALTVGNGGTGIVSYQTGDMLYATGETTLQTLSLGANNQLLTIVNGVPTWKTINLGDELLGVLPFLNGGTGNTNFTLGSVIFSDGTKLTQDNANFFWDDTNNRLGIGTTAPASMLSVGSTSQFQVSSSGAITATTGITSSGTVTFSGLSTAGIVTNTSGGILGTTLYVSVANGGTGAGTFTTNGILYGNTTGAIQVTAAGTDAQFLVANAGVPTFVSMSSDVTISNTGVATISANSVALTTDTTGNYVATITAGNGMSGSSSTEGGTPTIALGALTADWNQTGAYDISLDNASSELKIMESSGATYYGIFDVTDLSADRTYTFPDVSGAIATIDGGQTFTSAIWNGTSIGAQYGGTGINTSASTGVPSISGGTWTVTSSLGVALGGTNATSVGGAGSIAYSTGTAYAFSAVGTSGQVLLSGATGSPTWGLIGSAGITADSLDFTEFKDAMTLDASTDILITGTNVFSLTNTGTGNSFLVNDASGDTTPFVIDNAGSVGIGTTVPNYLLDVNGDINIVSGSHYKINGTNVTYSDVGAEASLGFTPENSANKVTSISGASTDIQYPSAKLLYDQLAGKIPTYGSQTAKYFLAAPNAGDGTPSFRAIIASDIPALSYAAPLSGTINEIAYFTSASAIGSLAVATYPSLTELSYVKGVTSGIQSQLNGKGAGTVTGTGTTNELSYWTSSTALGTLAVATYPSLTEISYVKGLSSAVQTQINSKQATLTNSAGLSTAIGGDVAVVDGGTGTSTGSITGTTALTFTAGGTNQNVTLTPSGTGYTILNGNVGIGTTSPLALLNIYGSTNAMRLSYDATNYSTLSANSTGELQIKGASVYDASLTIGSNDANSVAIIFDNLTNDFYIGIDNADSSKFKIGLPEQDAFMTILPTNGYIGIGTTAPAQMLQVGTSAAGGNVRIDNGWLCVDNNGSCTGAATAGTVYAVGAYTTGADYAEYFYTKDTDLKPGEAVCIDSETENAVKRCQNNGDNNIMGIVSSNPSIVGNKNHPNDDHYKIIGMLGQVAGEVSNENGTIKVGDSLTAGLIPGQMRKANAGESTVGVALQNFSDASGTIQILISRRNQSLTVEKVEQAVTDNITAMNIGDQVNALVSNAKTALDTQIANQSTVLTLQVQNIISLQNDIALLRSEGATEKNTITLLQSQMDLIKTQNQSAIDFMLTLNMDTLVYKDVLGNLDIGTGKFTAKDIEALGTVKAQDIEATNSLKGANLELGNTVSGTNVVSTSELESVIILTTEAKPGMKLYITPKGSTGGKTLYYDEADIIEGVSFKVKIDAPALDKDIEFNWLIVK